MSTRTVRAVFSLVIVGSALTVLLAMSVREEAAYFKHVDEVMASPEQWYGKNMKLHGFVDEGSLLRRPASLDYRFRVKNGDHLVQASYTGLVPDTFKEGSEVVLTGRLGPDGFRADEIMAKCPSKYEPGKPLGNR